MSTISGDVLLTSAFMAYGGYFDQQFRHSLFTSWATHLQEARISFRPDLARGEYLSNGDERLRWLPNSLPADDLWTENVIMIKRVNRYPLIVDLSGQATEFIMNEYKDKKITKTRFLNPRDQTLMRRDATYLSFKVSSSFVCVTLRRVSSLH
ncbi:PREDICTED: cytoplasmic dynein 1 heavy chain 1-like [Amphimedon queenslandica]|uniref:Dynein heavy chain ATP-binding dynein motor region domain-containing protein n=1 Tax=Amphimedon queenslandica TaxID=400682 RepID=A0AAN0JUH6_AMPQE|nr:PREDICTED: cytoplasmic dynein 1 heavy chain 1-like [Amphimedon queenslandica]XP_019860712.1 PREDICTED: cytoplasmic dynein 1 heavy chain 1-like [Amphimedon queenslandica]|eukprot:XP_019860711.1 PREDICTED: cytoplasmic dynein 1 heavy chain 1-like [Amphimedon queenslandica]